MKNFDMVKFNFEKGSLDFLKTIRKRDFFTTFLFLFLVALILRDDIKEFVLKDSVIQHDIFSEGVEEGLEMELILNEMSSKYDVDYIHLNLFHNGTKSASNYHFKKMSCVAEGKKIDKLPRIHKIQNWLISPIKEKLRLAKKDGHVYLDNLLNDKDVYFSKEVTKYGIESLFYVGLFDYRKKDSHGNPHFVGLICYEWEHPTNFTEAELAAMEKEKERLTEFIIK